MLATLSDPRRISRVLCRKDVSDNFDRSFVVVYHRPTAMQTVTGDTPPPSPGAVRMARHRRRRKRGMRCLTVELRESEINALIRRGLLAPDNRGDLGAVRRALYFFLGETLR
jgi:hypothetical protein